MPVSDESTGRVPSARVAPARRRGAERHPSANNAASASAHTIATRTVMSVSDMRDRTVAESSNPPVHAVPVWGIPFATVAFLVIGVVLGAMIWPMQRYETAPGTASDVTERLVIDAEDAASVGTDVYEPERGVRFVTALGNELNPLQSFMGWIDPYVSVQTCIERFGDCDPGLDKEIQLDAMASAKEIALFAAFDYLGIDVEFRDGEAQIGSFDAEICPDDAPERRACRVLEVGDTIRRIDLLDDNRRIVDSIGIARLEDVSKAIADAEPGDLIDVTVIKLRSDREETVTVELMASPSDPERTIIGFNARDTRTVDLPFDVSFDTDRIGGPSAGLAFTLAMIDELTPGELMPPGGVAATGTMSADGTVGPIGALVQKAVAVARSGAELFLVPDLQSPADLNAARRAVGSAVEIMPVGSLAEALAALAERDGTPLQPR